MYFSWGNTQGHAEGSSYEFSDAAYQSSPGYSIVDNLTSEQDAASVNLGLPWRMPTSADCQELLDNCTTEWVIFNGVPGRMFTSNVNGKTIFLPAGGDWNNQAINNKFTAGLYWQSTYIDSVNAKSFVFTAESINASGTQLRRYGFLIRPVLDPNI